MKTDTVRVPLTDLKGMGARSEHLAGLALYTNVDTEQEASLEGITFTLEYVNEGEQDAEIANPIDHIQYMILDAAGYPVKTPPSKSRIKIHTIDESQDLLKDKFLIISIREDDCDQDVQKQIEQKTISLAPGDRYSITLRITRIIEEETPIPIPPGTYSIVLTCSLVRTTDEGVDMRILQSQEIPVFLR
jgi:hypothetical protein